MRDLVLHVIPHLWSGAGAVVTRLCEAQRGRGPVAIVTSGSRGSQPDWPTYRARLRRAGVTHHTIDFYHRETDCFWSSAAALAELLRTLKPTVIHAHAGVPCGGAVVARALSGHRACIVGQMYSWGPDRPAWMNDQDMWAFGQADRVVCSARAYWDLLVCGGVPRRKLVYLPWGLPLDRLPSRGDVTVERSTTTSGRSGKAAALTMGFVGRIEPRKGQLVLVEAFARVRRRQPAARLELVGPIADQPYAERLRRVITAHGLEASVLLAGEVRDVTRYVRRWDLFVSLSADEGQGLAVLEAMALGVPVVARSVAGISDFLVDGRTGIALEEDGSARRAAEVIERAWQSPRLLQGIVRRARRLVERRYAWEQTVTAFERLYERT